MWNRSLLPAAAPVPMGRRNEASASCGNRSDRDLADPWNEPASFCRADKAPEPWVW